MKKKVIVGMSGGVDSSVAAYLLIQQGYEVEGLFMKNWEEDDTDAYCAAAADLKDAESVCQTLGIPLHRINFAAEYWDHVFENFLSEYRAGRTPNPDILCNKEIKFKAFLQFAKTLNADFIATGHYARRRDVDGRVQLLTGIDGNKDQTYFLYTLNQTQLSASLFPIGDYKKPEIREIAKKLGLTTFDKKDSTGICFIGERRFKDFLAQYLPPQPGPIITSNGKILGQHDGLMYYTIGQRSGLGIGGQANTSEEPWYVASKNMEYNQLIIVQGAENPMLYRKSLTAYQCYFTSPQEQPSPGQKVQAKVRYRQVALPCTVTAIEGEASELRMSIEFNAPVRAITLGQSVVLYDGEVCLGGGIIESTTF